MTDMFFKGSSSYEGKDESSFQFLYLQNLQKTFSFADVDFAKDISLNWFQVQKGSSFHLKLDL